MQLFLLAMDREAYHRAIAAMVTAVASWFFM
jgi:hypothetical protein